MREVSSRATCLEGMSRVEKKIGAGFGPDFQNFFESVLGNAWHHWCV